MSLSSDIKILQISKLTAGMTVKPILVTSEISLCDCNAGEVKWNVMFFGILFYFFFSSACQMDIHGKIREVLAETVRDDQGPAHQALSEVDFLHALQRRGIIDDVMKDLHFTQVAQHLTGNFQT